MQSASTDGAKAPPLILTLQLDEEATRFFDEMRSKYFPPAINYLKSHVTLFHNLPGTEEKAVLNAVAHEALSVAPFLLRIDALMKLGRGVAYHLESKELESLRSRLARELAGMLSRQDKEKFRPHVTIQNKVSQAEAEGLFDHLSGVFAPFDAIAEGVQLWRYEGGPWSPVAAVPFQGEAN